MVQQIRKPIVTWEDFTSCFQCVPENTALSYSIIISRSIRTTLRRMRAYKVRRNRLITGVGICSNDGSTFGCRILPGEVEECCRWHAGERPSSKKINIPLES
jgi:hypothetical protein